MDESDAYTTADDTDEDGDADEVAESEMRDSRAIAVDLVANTIISEPRKRKRKSKRVSTSTTILEPKHAVMRIIEQGAKHKDIAKELSISVRVCRS